MPDTHAETRLSDYAPPPFLVDEVDLTFELDEDSTLVRSRLSMRRNAPGELRLDGEDLQLVSVAIDGRQLPEGAWRLDGGDLVLSDPPDAFTLEIAARNRPRENTKLSGLYVSNGAFFTQCEAEGFRRITWFPDRPDVMARFTVTLIADRARCPVLLSNGNPAGASDDGDRHRARWVDPHPKPSYLFALVAGDLVRVGDSFRTRSGRDVTLGVYVRAGDEDKCGHALASLKKSMAWDEEIFGLEYDLDVFNIAAVSDFNMGAMENKGLNIFNTVYVLAKPDTATDGDFQGVESVIAHEYFHNWTGNRVTCRDWFQLSLKEGLTVFRDQEFSADQGSRAVKRIGDVRALRARQFVEDSGPLAHPVQPEAYVAIDNFYTATIYQKGAEVIRMMRTVIGAESFRRGMDLYFERHDNSAVRIEDFAQAMQDASGVDLTEFKRWYHQAGTPTLTVRDAWDEDARRYELTLSQSTPATPGQPDKAPLVIPVAMGLIGEAGEMPTRLEGENAAVEGTRVLMLSEAEKTFRFVDVASRPVPSLLRGFSAPVKLEGLTPEQLRTLAAHDTDLFTRWDSGEQYAVGALLAMVAALQRGEQPEVDAGLIEAIRAVLAHSDGDPEAAAQGLVLPSEQTLADKMAVADPDAIFAARQQAREAVARALEPELRAAYDALADRGPYRIDGRSIGRRALRNACLGYLSFLPDGAALAVSQFAAAGNMTDSLAALASLARLPGAERTQALAEFYERWRGEPLVLDKWFALQASAPLPDAVEQVRALMRHPDFDFRNPNRVRSVAGAFAGGNPSRFHAASGEGYALLADAILAVDALNGQLAALLVSPLGQWRRYDAIRQELMRAALERVLACETLTRNTREMAARSVR
jgi:aminopeptidase N